MEKFGGDTITLKQKLANLRKQCNEYDTLLKHFSVQINDLPPSIQKDLDEHAHFKKKTGLYEMDSSYLSEWYCTNAEKNIGKKIAILKFIASTEKNEKKLLETNNNLAEVKKFVDSLQNELQHDNTDRLLRETNQEMEVLIEKRIKMEENIKIDLDQILMKLDQLA